MARGCATPPPCSRCSPRPTSAATSGRCDRARGRRARAGAGGAHLYSARRRTNWLALAAEALAEHASLAQFSVDGEPVKGALYRRWSGACAVRRDLSSSPTPDRTPAQLVVTVSGAPIEPEPAAAQGYEIERSFYKLDGTKTDAAKHDAERARRRGAEDHRGGGALCAAAGRRPAARRARDRQSGAVRRRLDRRLLLAKQGRRARRIPNIATIVLSRRSIATKASRRSSRSPMSCARSRPATTSTRRRRPRTCTTPNASAAPPLGRSR